jgi:hypothetical protein
MNATTEIARTAECRLAAPSSVKLATCATLSLIITLLAASVIGQATGAASLAQSDSVSARVMTVSAR